MNNMHNVRNNFIEGEKMFEFKEFPSIENSYNTKAVKRIFEFGFNRYDYVVTEKIHGSNISFWMGKDGYKIARRTDFLREGEKFYNYKFVEELYKDRLFILYEVCKVLLNDLEELRAIEVKGDINVVLFGELFGGCYDHPDVKRDNDAVRIQKEVMYCPHNDFYAFDLMINGKFINYDVFSEMMEHCGFLYAKPMFRGNLEQCLVYPNEYITTIPPIFDLPEIEGNITEGNVIKPVYPFFFGNGERVILKNKNDKFKEKSRPKRKEKAIESFTDEESNFINLAMEFVTKPRMDNVVSKLGEFEPSMTGTVLKNYCMDVIADFEKENGSFAELDKKVAKAIKKNIQVEAKRFLKEL